MNKLMVAGVALVAGMALAAPLAAFGQNPAQPAAAAPAQQPSATAPGGQGMTGRGGMGMPGRMGEGMGPWSRGGRPMGWRRAMMRHRSPTERCRDRLARRAAMIAYTVTRLDLNARQRPLWDKLNATLQTGTQKEQQLCSALQASVRHGEPTILDRIDRRAQFLAAQLKMLQQARPELRKFYEALTPEQKAIINRPFRRG